MKTLIKARNIRIYVNNSPLVAPWIHQNLRY